jgi:hypothetical protein
MSALTSVSGQQSEPPAFAAVRFSWLAVIPLCHIFSFALDLAAVAKSHGCGPELAGARRSPRVNFHVLGSGPNK